MNRDRVRKLKAFGFPLTRLRERRNSAGHLYYTRRDMAETNDATLQAIYNEIKVQYQQAPEYVRDALYFHFHLLQFTQHVDFIEEFIDIYSLLRVTVAGYAASSRCARQSPPGRR